MYASKEPLVGIYFQGFLPEVISKLPVVKFTKESTGPLCEKQTSLLPRLIH